MPSRNPRTEVSPQQADLNAQNKCKTFLLLQSHTAAATPQHVTAPSAPGLAASAFALTQHTTTMETLSGVKSEALLSLMFAALQASAPAHCLSPVLKPRGDRADLWAQKCNAHLCHRMEKMAAAKFSVPLGELWLFPRQYCCPAAVTASLPMCLPSLDFCKLGVSLQF